MTAPLVLCACGQVAVAYSHSRHLPRCDSHATWADEPLDQAFSLPWPERRLDRVRSNPEREYVDSRWVATVDAARDERDEARRQPDALRAAVRAERRAAAEYAVAIDGGTDQEVARAWKRDTDAKQALLALLPPEAAP